MKKNLFRIAFVIFLSLLIFLGLDYFVPGKRAYILNEFQEKQLPQIYYVAIGDSLTEGVGDSTNSGGFVSICSDLLRDEFPIRVNTKNYGISGNTTEQIIHRMKEKKEIQSSLRKANIITITSGGNDLMAVIRENFAQLDVEAFEKPLVKYRSNIGRIIYTIREENKTAPIYFLGMYNPYYLNFSSINEMQEIVDCWNNGEKEVVEGNERCFFVPVNHLLYKGVDGKGVTTQNGENQTVENDALFAEDKFHPNDTGYQLMAKAVFNEMKKGENLWEKEK